MEPQIIKWTDPFLVTGAIGSFLVAIFLFLNSRRQVSNSVFQSLIERYQSAEMLGAVRRLYRLSEWCKANGKSLGKVYKAIEKRDYQEVHPVHSDPKDFAIEKTLHYQRRVVSHFYYYLAGAVRHRIIRRKLAFDFWSEKTISGVLNILFEIGYDDRVPLQGLLKDVRRHNTRHIRRLVCLCVVDIVAWFVLVLY